MITSAETLALIRKKFKENPQEGVKLANDFQTLRSNPESNFYSPHASGKSNYKELTDYFGVERFDDDFYRQNAGLTQYMRYGASGTPLAPTKKSKPEEVAAYQYYRAQKADEYTRTLESQWRDLQRELADKASFGMDDDNIVASIDWNKYGALRDYEDSVRIRNTPLLARPVSYSEESLYGVLSAVRKGQKVGQTDRDYLPELTDYYMEKSAQEEKRISDNANKPGLPGYQKPGTQNAGPVSDASNMPDETAPGMTFNFTFDNPPAEPEITPEQKKRQEQNEFSDLQYKINQNYDLSPEQYDRWMELYSTYSHTAGKSTFRVSASGGASDVTGGKSIRDQNEEWFTKYVGLINSGYTADNEHRMPSIEQLADYRNMASDMGMTVEQFFTEQYGGKPAWLEKIDYGEKRKTNPELITRMRPIEEVLPDYRAGKELSEAEYEMIWQYDKTHQNLLGGMQRGNAAYMFPAMDSRMSLGKTAFAALSAADSQEIMPEESNALILSIGQDMDAAFGRYDTLEEYYAANPERVAELQAFVDEEKARVAATAERDEADRIEGIKQKNQVAMNTLTAYANGDELDVNQKMFMDYMKTEPITDADKDRAYAQAEEALLNLSYEDLVARDKTYAQYTDVTVSMEFKRTALDALDVDVRLAKSAGISLSEMYEMFPEMKKDPGEMMDYARKAVEQKWAVDDPASIFGWLFGVNENELTGEGVGAGTALIKGAETGGRQFSEGYMGFARNYFTEADESSVQAWNRKQYGGPMGRVKASKDFDAAIAKIADPERKAYWEDYKKGTKDVYDLPFNFADESVLNSLYENKKAIEQIQSFMLSNGTPLEYSAFMLTSSLVDNGLSMGAAYATAVFTGNPTIGTAVGFGARTAYEASEIGRAAGLDQFSRNSIGAVAAGITAFTERIAFDKYLNMSALRGSARHLEALAMSQGAGFTKRLSAKIAFGAATIGTKLLENAGAEMGQEALENVLNDVWLNITSGQDKDFGAIVDDAAKAAVMAGILSPVLSGQAYLFTPKGRIQITDDMRNQAQQWMESKLSETMQNPETMAKAVEADAAAQTVEALTNGGLAELDTSAVEQAQEEVKFAEQRMTGASEAFKDARMQYADEMQKYVEKGKVVPAADHAELLKFIDNAGKLYESAKSTYTAVNEKFQQAKSFLNEKLSSIVKNARAESAAQSRANMMSEAAARNMAKADQIAEAQTVSNPVDRANLLKDRLNGIQDRVDGLSAQQEQAASDVQAAIDKEEAANAPDAQISVEPMSEELAAYFVDSKVRSKKGLTPVFHGTKTDVNFDRFETWGKSRYGLFGVGAYFTEDSNIAKQYTSKGKGNSPRVYSAYLDIKNPIDMDADADHAKWDNMFRNFDVDTSSRTYKTNEDAFRILEQEVEDQMLPKYEGEEFMLEALESMGYDGITHIGGGRTKADSTKHRVWIAFDQEQIHVAGKTSIDAAPKTTINASPTPDAPIAPASDATAVAEVQAPANVPPAQEGLYGANMVQESQGGAESKFVTETLPKNTNLTQEQKDLVESYRYTPVTNDAQVDRANTKITSQGYQQTVNEIMSEDFVSDTPDAQALMQVVITQAAQQNDVNNLRNVLFKYAEVGSDAGQVLQARTILNRLSPEGFLTHVVTSTQRDQKAVTGKWDSAKQKSVDNEVSRVAALGTYDAIANEFGLGKPNMKHYNRATIKQRMEAALQHARDNNGDIGKLAKDLVLIRQGVPVVTNADIDYINSQMKMAKEYDVQGKQRDHNVALNRAYEANANIHAATLGEKYITFLKTNMLANVKTNVRNIQSNVLFAPMEAISQYIGAAMDYAVSKVRGSDRTTSAITPKDAFTYAKNFFDEAVNTYKDYMVDKVDTSKTQIERNLHTKRTFQNPILEAYKNITSFALALGDRPFWAGKFHMSVYQQQRLNGSTDVTQDMIDAAIAEANYAVYQEDNRVATAINNLKTSLGGAGVIIDWVIPFTRTPTNIAKRMFEYSPASIVKALGWDMLHEGKKGNFDQKKFVMDMARGITGTGMMLIGAALRHGGILKPGDDNEPVYDLIYTERAAGAQPDNTIKIGDRSYTISSIQPFSTPLLLGASLYDTFNTDTAFWSSMINGAVQSGDTLLDATFLQNLAALFSGEGDSITENIASGITSSALSQMVPSLLRQTANALDAYARDTNDTSKDPLTRGVMKKLKKNLISYIPFWRNTLPEQVEITGEPVQSITGIFDNYINPLYVTTDKNDSALDELLRLAYVAQAENRSLSFLPSDDLYGSRSDIPNGARPLTESEKVAYKKRKGTLLFDGGKTLSESGASVTMPGLRALMASDTYKRMTDQQKEVAINGQVTAANQGVNAEYLKILGAKTKGEKPYMPKAATSVPTYFTDNNPWYMQKLNGYYDDTGDASFLPTAIGTTFERTIDKKKKSITVPQEKVDAYYKLYDAELSKKLSNLDWSLTGQELAKKVAGAISDAQTDTKDKWVKEGYWR